MRRCQCGLASGDGVSKAGAGTRRARRGRVAAALVSLQRMMLSLPSMNQCCDVVLVQYSQSAHSRVVPRTGMQNND